MKVLIVGAGPTGLTAALEFARRGITPEIVDAKKAPSELSRAVGILPETIQKLRTTAAGNLIFNEGIKFRGFKLHRGSKVLLHLNLARLMDSDKSLIGLPQDRTEALMSEALEKLGTKVTYNCKVTDVKTMGKDAVVAFENGQSKTYDWVIGSDGVSSTIREKLGIRYLGYELPEIWSIADVELHKNYRELAQGWILEGSTQNDIIIAVPIGPARIRIVSSTPDSIEVLPIKLDIKKVRRTGTFKIPIKQAESYVKGRVVLAGDAAHAHSPVGGRGMNLGIDDAIAAVKAILEDTLSEYNSERRKIGARIIKQTENIRRALVSTNYLTKISINVLLKLVQNIGFLRTVFVKRLLRL